MTMCPQNQAMTSLLHATDCCSQQQEQRALKMILWNGHLESAASMSMPNTEMARGRLLLTPGKGLAPTLRLHTQEDSFLDSIDSTELFFQTLRDIEDKNAKLAIQRMARPTASGSLKNEKMLPTMSCSKGTALRSTTEMISSHFIEAVAHPVRSRLDCCRTIQEERLGSKSSNSTQGKNEAARNLHVLGETSAKLSSTKQDRPDELDLSDTHAEQVVREENTLCSTIVARSNLKSKFSPNSPNSKKMTADSHPVPREKPRDRLLKRNGNLTQEKNDPSASSSPGLSPRKRRKVDKLTTLATAKSAFSTISSIDTTPLPPSFQPLPYSVIVGSKKKEAQDHIGNRRLRVLASIYLAKYTEAFTNKPQKSAIVSSLVDVMNDACPLNAGFVRLGRDGNWHRVSDNVAREKVGYTLRELLGDKYRSSSKAKAAMRDTEGKGGKWMSNSMY